MRDATEVHHAHTLADLADEDPALTLRGDPATAVSGIQYDSRLVGPGDLFVALRGGYFDGHAFVDHALARGATAIMVEEPLLATVAQIVAPDTRAALPRIAAAFYDHPSRDMRVVGITGTDGKTTTSYLLNAILRDAGHVTGMVGTVSVQIAGETVDHETRQTTPESLDVQRLLRQMRTSGVETAILEATSHGLDLHRLDEVAFDLAAVTNITHEHLEHHKTIAAYRRAKGILFERVGAVGGVAVVNADDEGAREMIRYAAGADVVCYSMDGADVEILASEVEIGRSGSRFRLHIGAADLVCTLPLLGAFNIANALCAAGLAHAIGIDAEQIVASLAKVAPVKGRMARVDEGQPFSVIVDYAHTPDSLAKVLQLLRALHPAARIIAVSGSAGERDIEKRPLQGAVSTRYADVSVFTSEDPRFEDADEIIAQIARGAEDAGGVRGRTYVCVTDRRAAIDYALGLAGPGDCILLAGKGHERSMIWGLEKRPWDEAEVAAQLLRERGYSTHAAAVPAEPS